MKQQLKSIYHATLFVFERFFKDGFSARASALAYASLLALVPSLILTFTILSPFPAFRGITQELQSFVINNFIPTSADLVSQYITNFLQQVQFLSVPNLLFLSFVVILLLYNMSAAFNKVWHTQPKIHFTLSFLIYLVILIIAPLLFALIILFSTYVFSLPLIEKLIAKTHIEQPFFLAFPYLFTFAVFTFFNWLIPAIRVRLRHALLGALVTTVLFEFSKRGFIWYLAHVRVYQVIYGGLAIVPLFLVWLYISWATVIVGGLVANVAAKGIRRTW